MNFKRTLLALIVIGATSLFAASEAVKTAEWELNKNWKLEDGNFINSKSSLLFLKKKPMFTEMELETEITLIKAESKSWKLAGLVLYKTPTEYWQLALIEAPDKYSTPKRHFVELKCKKGKVWGHESKLKLKRLMAKTFNWEYGKTYKMKLKLSPERIDGFVYAKDSDKVLAHIAFELKDGTVKTGTPALKCSSLKASFSKVKLAGK